MCRFANMNNVSWELVAYDPWFDLSPTDEGCDAAHCKYDSYRRVVALKQRNPQLKVKLLHDMTILTWQGWHDNYDMTLQVLLSIGGWNSGSEQWSWMAADSESRATFVASVMRFVETFGWDGIDFDWEYPGDREGADPDHDRDNFTLLSQELAAALHSQGKLFTAATSADHKRLAVGG